MAALIAKYRETQRYKTMAPSTKRGCDSALDAIEAEFGAVIYRDLEHPEFRAEIEDWRDGFAVSVADAYVARFATLIDFGMERYAIGANRARKIERLYEPKDYAEQRWTADELDALLDAARPHLARAIRFALLTGLRSKDVTEITWAADEGSLLRWATSKSRRRQVAHVPVTPDLRALLNECPKTATTIITGVNGRPMSHLGDEFRAVRDRLGLTKRFHDLRGNAVTRLITLNLSDREISVIMGVSQKNVARWRRKYVDDRAIAEAVVVRLSEHRRSDREFS